MARELLFVSALQGGAAEALLRAIAHESQEGIGHVPSMGLIERNVRKEWTFYRIGQLSKEACLALLKPVLTSGEVKTYRIKETIPVRFVLGAEIGVVLRNDSNLSRKRNFSTLHQLGPDVVGIDYVFPVSPRILAHTHPNDPEKALLQVNANFRCAVSTICDFLIHNQGEVLRAQKVLVQERAKTRAAERLEKKKKNRREIRVGLAERGTVDLLVGD